ncbi:MFS transporter [Chloroflexota bacterium]
MRISQFPRINELFYGYRIIAAIFFSLAIISGCGLYAFGLFVHPLEAAFGWSRGEIMTASMVFALVMGITAPFIGKLITRYGARRIMTPGAIIGGLGFALLPLMSETWHFYALYAVIALGYAAIGLVPATMVVSNWFKKRRGTAIGIMSVGVGLGGLVLAPLIGGYLIPNFGWQTSYLFIAGLTWTFIPLALFVIRTQPSDMGLYADGMPAPEQTIEPGIIGTTPTDYTLKTAIITSAFWLIAISFLVNSFSHLGVLQNQAAHLEDISFSPAIAGTTAGLIGLGSTFGKFFFGWLCDRMPVKYVWAIANCFQVAGIVILLTIEPTSPQSLLWTYAILFGFGIGGWLPTMSILTSDNFGIVHYGLIFGTINLIHSFGSATGPLFAGNIFDSTGSYQFAFNVFLILYIVTIATALVVRRPKPLANLN